MCYYSNKERAKELFEIFKLKLSKFQKILDQEIDYGEIEAEVDFWDKLRVYNIDSVRLEKSLSHLRDLEEKMREIDLQLKN